MITPMVVIFMSCATPVKKDHWEACEILCFDHKGVMEACNEIRLGRGCHCVDDTIFWFDKKWEIRPNEREEIPVFVP